MLVYIKAQIVRLRDIYLKGLVYGVDVLCVIQQLSCMGTINRITKECRDNRQHEGKG